MPTNRLREDCGGTRFLDLRGLALVVPFAVVTSVATSSAPDVGASARWVVVNLAAFALAAPVVFLARWATARWFARPVHVGLAIAVGAALGAVKGLGTTGFATLFGLLDDPLADVVGRVANTAALGAIAVPSIAAVLAARDRWAAEHDLLVVELVRRTLDTGGRGDADYRRTLRGIVERAGAELARHRHEEWPTVLRTVVDRDLRPLSASVLAATEAPTVSRGWNLLRTAVEREPLSSALIAVSFGASTALLTIRHGDVATAVGYGLVLGAMTWLVFAGAQCVRQRWPGLAVAALVAAIAIVAAAQAPVSHRVVGVVEALDHAGVTIGTAVWLAELAIVMSMITAARRERAEVRARLLELLGPRGVSDAVGHGVRAIDGRDFAFFVHGDLQNRLLALAERIEQDGREPRAVIEVSDVLAAVTATEPPNASLGAGLDEVVRRWRGVAEIDLDIGVDCRQLAGGVADRLVHVVVEAVTNAVRHGAAQHITVQIEQRPPRWAVTITDDGFGPRRGRRGTGSHYFDIVAPGSWSLLPRPAGGGAVLTLLLS